GVGQGVARVFHGAAFHVFGVTRALEDFGQLFAFAFLASGVACAFLLDEGARRRIGRNAFEHAVHVVGGQFVPAEQGGDPRAEAVILVVGRQACRTDGVGKGLFQRAAAV